MQLKSRNIIYDPISILVLLMKKYPNIENAYSVVSKRNLRYMISNSTIIFLIKLMIKILIVIQFSTSQEIK